MAFVVVYDACVLYPFSLRDLLVRLGMTGLFQAKWTDEILDECFDHLAENRPDLKDRLERTRTLMNRALPDAMVTGYEPLIPGLQLPDEDDRHVLAAAIRSGAQVIVTANLNDFPEANVSRWNVEAQDPDTFVEHVLSLNSDTVLRTVGELAAARRAPPQSTREVLETLKQHGLRRSADRLLGVLNQRENGWN